MFNKVSSLKFLSIQTTYNFKRAIYKEMEKTANSVSLYKTNFPLGKTTIQTGPFGLLKIDVDLDTGKVLNCKKPIFYSWSKVERKLRDLSIQLNEKPKLQQEVKRLGLQDLAAVE